jgi:hypothetical protein
MANLIDITDFYDILVAKVGKAEAKAITSYIENKIERDLEVKTRHLATREDLERGFKEQGRWFIGSFVALALMILGLYATILLK